MSLESAAAFYERLEREPELTERIRELNTPDRIGPYVKGELGYDFTREEMQQVIFERNPEMTDEEMEAVVGGLDPASLAIGGLIGVGAAAGIVVGCAVIGAFAVAAAA